MGPQTPSQLKKTVRIARPQELARHVVVVDGASCSGKSLVSPILSSFDRGELWLTDHIFEYLCAIDALGRIERDAAKALCRLYADFDLYNLQISRYTNLKPTDITSANQNLLQQRHEKRLLAPDGDVVVKSIHKRNPYLIIMTHYIFHYSDLLFDAFGQRLKNYVLTVRHPLWLIENWFEGKWEKRVGQDPREFQLCAEIEGETIPWYAASWAKDYQGLNALEKTIRTIYEFHIRFEKRRLAMDDKLKKRFYLLPYELFAADPEPYVKELAQKLQAKPTPLTQQIIKKLRLPRPFSNKILTAQRDKMETLMRGHRVKLPVRRLLERLCEDYEQKYLPFNSTRPGGAL